MVVVKSLCLYVMYLLHHYIHLIKVSHRVSFMLTLLTIMDFSVYQTHLQGIL